MHWFFLSTEIIIWYKYFPKHRFTRLLSMMGFAEPLFDHLFVWRLNEFKDDLVWLQHDNWSELHYSSVTQCSLSCSTYWAFPKRVRSFFSRVFCLTCPHILLSKLALVKLEILERSVIDKAFYFKNPVTNTIAHINVTQPVIYAL